MGRVPSAYRYVKSKQRIGIPMVEVVNMGSDSKVSYRIFLDKVSLLYRSN